MSKNSIYSKYIPAINPPHDTFEFVWMFVFSSTSILISEESESLGIPTSRDFNGVEISFKNKQYLGLFDGYPCYCMELETGIDVPDGMILKDLRTLLGRLEEDLFLIAGRAFQIVNWNRMNAFCGKCGNPTEAKQNELAKLCPCCDSVYYPRISPAVIVAIVRGDKILLAHNRNFRSNWYSVIAGFVEPGETFEECVAREVMEEVGIRVRNIKYFGSQPWPFPDSLMVGFTAEYDSGDIVVDGTEIDAADWYGRDNLPSIPNNNTIAGRLIESVITR